MRQLRLVHLTDDGTTLLLERADGLDSGEQFHLPVDAVLRHAVRTERPRPEVTPPAAPAPEPGVELSPRDIQMRVRAGESPDALAQAHGDSLDKIMRFAGPVLQERARIADEARRGRARRTTTDGTVVSFGETVDSRFAAHGIDPADVAWDAQRPHGEWLVVARWMGGAGITDDDSEPSEHSAEWMFHRSSRTVTPVDDAAIDLLSDRPIRPLVPPEPEPPAPPRLAPGVFVFPPMPEAATGPLPRVEEVFDQEAPPEGPVDLEPLAAAPAEHLDAPAADNAEAGPDTGYDEPPLPLGAWTPAPDAEHALADKIRRTKPGRGRHSAATRTKVPSWDDILLGVRRESD